MYECYRLNLEKPVEAINTFSIFAPPTFEPAKKETCEASTQTDFYGFIKKVKSTRSRGRPFGTTKSFLQKRRDGRSFTK
jgi:hypothetical protein